jgi:hypothetical protein
MSEVMRDDHFDRELRAFLEFESQDIVGVPTASEAAVGISSRAGTRAIALRLAPQLVWVLIAVLLMVALFGAAVFGAKLLAEERGLLAIAERSYEGVFLRFDEVDEAPQVTVVGVNIEGRERQIATLPGAWVAFNVDPGSDPQFLAPMGAVSQSGLLAMPSNRDELAFGMMQWEIFDLHAPEDQPLVITAIPPMFVEQLRATPSWHSVDPRGGVFWGPEERVAIAWYGCYSDGSGGCPVDRQLSFVDGRTGEGTSIDISEDWIVIPSWASDASGVLVQTGTRSTEMSLLKSDGSLVDYSGPVAEGGCRTRFESGAEIAIDAQGGLAKRNPDGTSDHFVPTGAAFACLAPDESMIAHGTDSYLGPDSGFIDPETGADFDVEGSFAGWLEVVR